jgi:hypothetical protein
MKTITGDVTSQQGAYPRFSQVSVTIVEGKSITIHGKLTPRTTGVRLTEEEIAAERAKGSPLLFKQVPLTVEEHEPCTKHEECIESPELGRACTARGEFSRTFHVGDAAEYDSFNLSYMGRILNVTAKTVVVENTHYENKTCRMKLWAFVWRNWDLDVADTLRRNAETSMSL